MIISLWSLPLLLLSVFLIPILIYFFVTHQVLSFTFITSSYLLSFTTLFIVMAVIGPIVMGIYGYFSPHTAVYFSNWGGNFILIIEGYLTYLILKWARPIYQKYTQVVVRQQLVIAWIINVFYVSFFLVRFSYHVQLLKVAMPIYFLSAIACIPITLGAMKISTKYFAYRDLATSQAIELQNLQTYTSHIETMYDDLRRFRHDYKNILLSLEDVIKTGTIEQVQQLFNQIVLPTNDNLELRTAVLGHLKNIENLEIKSLVYSKVITAINQQINITVEVADPIKLSPAVELVDVLRMISILFDNAINAAQQTTDKRVNFSFFAKAGAQYIVVGNSTQAEHIDPQSLRVTLRASRVVATGSVCVPFAFCLLSTLLSSTILLPRIIGSNKY